MLKIILLCALSFLPLSSAHADTTAQVPYYIQDNLDDAALVGRGRLTFFMWDVYDAFLYAPDGLYTEQGVYALRLKYLRALKGHDIADQSIKEIKKQGFTAPESLENWRKAMKDIFPDVYNGTILTGIKTSDGETVFFKNGVKIGQIADPEFTHLFFNIWLGQTTSVPTLRKQLLAIAK